MKQYYVYIMSSKTRTLYTGVTNNLERRVYEHKNKFIPGFTAKYNLTWLVWFAETNDIREAIAREKQIKAWPRAKRVELIEEMNPEWEDLSAYWYSKENALTLGSDSSPRSE
jgi:putative endonuclease